MPIWGALRATGAVAVLALATASFAAEPTADELIAKNLAARGGADKLAAVQSLQFKGKLRFPGDFELDYNETRARASDAVRIDAALQGLTLVQAYDGSTGWRINPFQGRRDAEQMSGDEARSIADSGLIDGALLRAKTNGARIDYMGREDFDGTLAYKLRVQEKDGDQFVYFLDPDSFLEIAMTETRRVRGAEQVTEYELGEYEKVGDVYYPMSVESWPRGSQQRQKLTIETAQANVPVTAAMFAMPGASTPNTRGSAGSSTTGETDAAQSATTPDQPPVTDKPDTTGQR